MCVLAQLWQTLEHFVNIWPVHFFKKLLVPGSIYLWTLTQQLATIGMAASSASLQSSPDFIIIYFWSNLIFYNVLKT